MLALVLIKRRHCARTIGKEVRRRRTKQEAPRAAVELEKDKEQAIAGDEERRCSVTKVAILQEIKNPPFLKRSEKTKLSTHNLNPTLSKTHGNKAPQEIERNSYSSACLSTHQDFHYFTQRDQSIVSR